MTTWEIIQTVADASGGKAATFDQLAEEVMELHLSMRGKHPDTPAMEWLEIATIAANAFAAQPADAQQEAFENWQQRHGAQAQLAGAWPGR